MKILFFADIHSSMNDVSNILKIAEEEKVEALVCAGDLSEFGKDLRKITKKLSENFPFYIIPGNHEDEEEINELASKFKNTHNLHLKAVKIKNILLIGCGGGGFSHYHTPFKNSEKYFRQELRKLKDPSKVILVTHAPPYKTKLDIIHGEHTGVKLIRKFIEKEQPSLAVCGHLHENMGIEDYIGKTKVINPGEKGFIFKA